MNELDTYAGRTRAQLRLTDADQRRLNAARAATRSPRTKKLYKGAFDRFVAWCERRRAEPVPAEPDLVALYLTERAELGCSVSTLALDLTAISQAHAVLGLESPRSSPRLAEAWKGIKRQVGQTRGARPSQKSPLVADEIAAMVRATPDDTLAGLRDRALLSLGFAGAFRRSELVALEARDLELVPGRGLRVTVRTSKTDQEGEGHQKRITFGSGPACPVQSVRRWRDVAGVDSGPLFRRVRRGGVVGADALTARSVARIIKAAAERVGFEPERYSGHSLRAGHVTSQLEAGVDTLTIRRATGHRSDRILAEYDRRRDVWVESGL